MITRRIAFVAMTVAAFAGAAVVAARGQSTARPGEPTQSRVDKAVPKSHTGTALGAGGGVLGGAAMGYSSAGILCTIGGPLCQQPQSPFCFLLRSFICCMCSLLCNSSLPRLLGFWWGSFLPG